MTSRFQHPSYTGEVAEPERHIATDAPPKSARPGLDLSILARAERSCCCPARPAVVVMMPPSAGRAHATDLLLCMHHYRASEQALARAGATAADESGRVLLAPNGSPAARAAEPR